MRILSRLLLAVSLIQFAPTAAQTQTTAPPSVKKEFDGFIAKFRAALKANDAAAVSGMALLPFQGDASVSNAVQFREKIYRPNFTKQNRACIRRETADYERDGENRENFFIFCDELIFTFTKTSSGFLLTDISVND